MDCPSEPLARIGIIGGTGLYRLPEDTVLQTLDASTPFGPPSSPVTVARLAGLAGLDGPDRSVIAFLSRHGREHSIAPQQINHRANLRALRSVGVEVVISSAAVGGLVPSHGTGTFAVPDQFLDRTWGRADTFYDGSLSAGVLHLPAVDPYSAPLRAALIAALELQGEVFAPTATVAVVNGPRFSTRAESAPLVQAGAHLVSMTQYPEPVLAAELRIRFLACSLSMQAARPTDQLPGLDSGRYQDPQDVDKGQHGIHDGRQQRPTTRPAPRDLRTMAVTAAGAGPRKPADPVRWAACRRGVVSATACRGRGF